MQPVAKKCLWWAAVSAVAAVGLQLVMTYVPWLWNGSFGSYLLPTWYTVVNLLAVLVSGVLFPLAAILIGVAILINVLVPRIDARNAAADASAGAHPGTSAGGEPHQESAEVL
ncbi:MAG: hypothetical protein ACK5IM_00965, partial [Demequina sp.]|uniref:hypothetical protein n=1 Tax=Demequina sp. TaxID=2050685 RepID=UPI003A846F2C